MIFIFVASFVEAKPLISCLNLKRQNDIKPFEIYKNCIENHKAKHNENKLESDINNIIYLTITNQGKENAAAAVGYMMGKYFTYEEESIVLNIGIAAGNENTKLGEFYQINKIHSIDSGRDYFPFIYDNYFKETTLLSGSKILDNFLGVISKKDISSVEVQTKKDNKEKLLYDMESEGIFLAALHFVTPDRIIILKAVSDNGVKASTNLKEDINKAIENFNSEILLKYINHLGMKIAKERKKSEVENSLEKNFEFKNEKGEIIKFLLQDLKCSSSMELELEKLLGYANSAGIDINQIINTLYREKVLPVKSRADGKKVLLEIKEKILSQL